MVMSKDGKNDNGSQSENEIGGELTPLSDLQDILNEFPINDISHAFGYGSGVFEQKVVNSDSDDNSTRLKSKSKSKSKSRESKSEEIESDSDGDDDQDEQQQDQQQQQQQPMIDLILSTSNAKQWHDDNLKMNPSHYALLPRMFGASFISQVQDVGAGVYFNPMAVVKTNTSSTAAGSGTGSGTGTERVRLVKYGIIEDEILKSDLRNWDCMYIAGRMHKPIATFNQPYQDDEILYLQEEYNLKYAIATALLLTSGKDLKNDNGIGDCDNDEEKNTTTRIVDVGRVFEAIAGLSYIGDPRLAAGAEDPLKVKKLVHSQGQWDRFYSVYETQFQKLERKGLLTLSSSRLRPTNMGSHRAGNSVISASESAYSCSLEIDLYDRSTRRELYRQLPPRLQQDSSISSLLLTSTSTSTSLERAEVHASCQAITASLSKIVGPPAKAQSAKGLVSAGLYKSIAYVGAKLTKGALKGII